MQALPWSRCGHLRQRRLPCATPECGHTVKDDEIKARVINPPGRRRGWDYNQRDIPEHYVDQMTWSRTAVMTETSPEPLCFMWSPSGDNPEDLPSRKCFISGTALFCPVCGTYLSNSPLHKKLDVFIGCPGCKKYLRPVLRQRGHKIEWYEVKGPLLAVSPAILVMEYPE